MTVIIACLIAGISIAAFLALWVVTSYRELGSKKQEVTAVAEQVQMHRTLYRQTRGSPNGQAAKKMLETSRMVYAGTVKGYNNCLKNRVYRLPGFVMGFRRVPEKIKETEDSPV